MRRKWIIIIVVLILLIIGISLLVYYSNKKDSTTEKTITKEEVVINNIAQRSLEVDFIDVGQGDSELIKTPNNKTLLIDCGDNSAGLTVINYLKSKNVNTIDVLITTHPDADHIGGCDDVLENFNVIQVFDDGVTKNTLVFKDYSNLALQTEYYNIRTDFELDLDKDINLQVIVPYDTVGINEDVNENSVLIKLTYKNTSFLFTGDCEEDCEKAILDADLDVDVLKVGHHGSTSSSSDAFLQEVTPKISVISVGAGNKYGHPQQETLQKLSNTEIFRTDVNGVITIITNGQEYEVSTEK